MSDKIEISFDDEPDKPEQKIVVSFDEGSTEESSAANEEIKEDIKAEEPVIEEKVNSSYKGNAGLSNYFVSRLSFPEGIERGFRKKWAIDLKDEFFNSILEDNKDLILSSKNGNIYFIDKKTGAVKDKKNLSPETFEKTGIVYENCVIISSLSGIHILDCDEKISERKVYTAPEGYFIWSHLNRYQNYILFTEYSPTIKRAHIKILDLPDGNVVLDDEITIKSFISDTICVTGENAYISADGNLIKIVMPGFSSIFVDTALDEDENCILFSAGNRLFINDKNNGIYYSELFGAVPDFKYTGIKNNYLNSMAGFEDNVWIGTIEGWKYYKTSGMQVYSHEDADENFVRAVSSNVLVVSKKNRVIFHNLQRFQEAEGFTITVDGEIQPQEIIASIITGNDIVVLTQEGILTSFTNDKLNLHI